MIINSRRLAATGVIIIVISLYFATSKSNIPQKIASDNNDILVNIDNTTVKMGNIILKIPSAYYAGKPNHEGKYSDLLSFIIMGLYPDFEEPSLNNIHEFQKTGWNRKIVALVMYKQDETTGKERLQLTYDHSDKNLSVGPNNYQRFTRFGENGPGSTDIFFRGTFDAPTEIVECDTEKSGPYPGCRAPLRIDKNIVVDLSFSREYLSDVANIKYNFVRFLNDKNVGSQKIEITE